jgi:AcrR family transcriptional regulator
MSPRPRKVTDEEIFGALQRAMSRLGPGELTLAEVASEAGVTAGALVQRFGSKRALLLALAERAAGSSDRYIDELARQHDSPLAALRVYAECMAGLAESPAALARNLAYLQIDLNDADFRRHLHRQARSTRAGIKRLLTAAVRAGELSPDASAEALSRTVETILSGSLMTWALYQEGSAAQWLRYDLDAALAPYLARKRRSRERR